MASPVGGTKVREVRLREISGTGAPLTDTVNEPEQSRPDPQTWIEAGVEALS